MSQPASKPDPQPPDDKFERWTAQRKAAVIMEVLKGQLSVPEACRKYGIPQGEYRKWADEFYRGGVEALKTNRRGIDAQYRAEIKRLQAKIGELVMVDEIRKEALRPFLAGDETSNESSPS
jgi:transposase-like protein